MPRIAASRFDLTLSLDVELPEPLWLERMRARLPPGHEDLVPAPGEQLGRRYALRCTRDPRFEPRDYVLSADGRPLLMSRDAEAVLDAFEADVDRFLALRALDHVFVQAGVVRCAAGALVMPRAGSVGTSTLVHALVGAGAAYMSERIAVFDVDGRVLPYPREVGYQAPSPESNGDLEPVSLAAVVLTSYREGLTWDPVDVSAGQSVLSLLDSTPYARDRPEDSFRLLGRACRGTTGLRSERGEAATVASDLMARFGA